MKTYSPLVEALEDRMLLSTFTSIADGKWSDPGVWSSDESGIPSIIDNGATGFTRTSGFLAFSGQGFQNDVHYAAAGTGSQKATWTFNGVSPNTSYRVAATYTPHANRATNAPFTVFDGTSPLETVVVNQELVPNDFVADEAAWETLGTFSVTGTQLRVQLSNLANEYVIADAIRIEPVVDLLPSYGDSVVVNHNVIYDVVSDYVLDSLEVAPGGYLGFLSTQDARLVLHKFDVHGWVQIGVTGPVSEDNTVEIIFADGDGYTNELDVENGWFIAAGQKRDRFVRLAQEALAGQDTVYFAESVNWRKGDTLFFPRVHSVRTTSPEDFDVRTIVDIDPEGKWAILDAPLSYSHTGSSHGYAGPEFMPHVGNFTSNVNIKSANPHGNRGYVEFAGGGRVVIENVGFWDLGSYSATNPGGWAGVQFEDYVGSAGYTESFIFSNNVVGNFIGHEGGDRTISPYYYGLVLKNSHHGVIEGNFINNWAGAGIIMKNGNEYGNLIRDNFIALVSGTGDRDLVGYEGAGIHMRAPTNKLVDNVVADVRGGLYSYGYLINNRYNGTLFVPTAPGGEEFVALNPYEQPLMWFDGNETYGVNNGLTIWWVGSEFWTPRGPAGTVKDFAVWNYNVWGYFGYETNNLILDGWTVRGDILGASEGIQFGDYMTHNTVIRNCDVRGSFFGIRSPDNAFGETLIENCYFDNTTYGVVVVLPWSVSGGGGLPGHSTRIRNPQFGGNVPNHIMKHFYVPGGQNIMVRNEVFVEDYLGQPGNDFKVYHYEQHKDAIPQGSDPSRGIFGSPEPGLTNQQLWEKYGMAVSSEVLPDNHETLPQIVGYIVRSSSPLTIGFGSVGFTRADGQGYEDSVHYAAPTAEGDHQAAWWVVQGLTPGQYIVSTTWSEHENRATNAIFVVYDSDEALATAVVNQELAPDDEFSNGVGWETIGTVDVTEDILALWMTADGADDYVIADAVRITKVGDPTFELFIDNLD